MLKKIVIKEGVRCKQGYKETLPESSTDSKTKARYQIQENVFDIKDSIADNAKMISLVLSVMKRMWETTPQAQKDLMSTEDLALINSTFDLFASTTTHADNLFAGEGFALVERLMQRQQQVGDILK